MVIDELLVGLGFKYDPEGLAKFKTDVAKTRDVLKHLTKVALGSVAAITAFTVVSTRASDEQGKLADEIGENVSTIDALQFAMRRAGGSSDGMARALKSLSEQAAAAARGVGSGIEAFGILGISATDANGKVKKSSELMLEISNAFKNFSKQQQIELAGKLGISDSIRLLQQGASGIKELTNEAKKLGVTTSDDAEIAAKFQDSLTDIWQITKQVSRVIVRQLAPGLTHVKNLLTDWWVANRKIIEQKLPQWIHAVKLALVLLTAAAAVWIEMKLIRNLVTLIALFRTLAVSASLADAAILILPALIGAIVTAIALLANDASTFFNGGQSFIGDMIKKYPQWTTQLTAVAAVFATISDLTTMIFTGWDKIFSLFGKLSIKNLKDVAKNIPGFLADAVGLKRTDNTGVIPDIAKFFGADNTQKSIPGVANFLGAGNAQKSIANDVGSTTNKTSSTNVDKMDIVIQAGIDNPKQIANAVLNAFQQTSQDLNSVVDQ